MTDRGAPAVESAREARALMLQAMDWLEQEDALALSAAHLQQAIDALPDHQSSAAPRA